MDSSNEVTMMSHIASKMLRGTPESPNLIHETAVYYKGAVGKEWGGGGVTKTK